MRHYSVIGGGIAGLTAAYKLKRSGYSVKLFEASNRIGGKINTVEKGGFRFEFGPTSMTDSSLRVKKFIDNLDIKRKFTDMKNKNRYVVKNGKLLPIPLSIPKFITSKLFSPKGTFRVLFEPFATQNPTNDDESVEQFFTRRLGKEIMDYAINPFITGIYAGDPGNLSMSQVFSYLADLEKKYGSLFKGLLLDSKKNGKSVSGKIYTYDNGLKSLTEALAGELIDEIQLNSNVTGITNTNSKWNIKLEKGSNHPDFDGIIYTGPLYQLQHISVNESQIPEFRTLSQVEYPPIAVFCMGFRREDIQHKLNGFGFLVPEVENANILGCIFSSSIFPGNAPDRMKLLTVMMGGVRQPELALAPVESQMKMILSDLKNFIGVNGEPVLAESMVIKKSIPQYNLGYGDIITTLEKLETEYTGLYFSGNFRQGVSIGDTIDCSLNLCEKILNNGTVEYDN